MKEELKEIRIALYLIVIVLSCMVVNSCIDMGILCDTIRVLNLH